MSCYPAAITATASPGCWLPLSLAIFAMLLLLILCLLIIIMPAQRYAFLSSDFSDFVFLMMLQNAFDYFIRSLYSRPATSARYRRLRLAAGSASSPGPAAADHPPTSAIVIYSPFREAGA